MWRNREVQWFIGIVVVLAAGAVAWVAQISAQAAIVTAIIGLVIILVCILYSWWRYRALAKLISQVKRINAGDHSLDLTDNREGELSALKSDIAKLASGLTTKQEQSESDKQKLSAAIGDISHQLKTPLTSLMMFNDILAEDQLDPDKRSIFSKRSSRQLERIEWLVQSLLKLSRIDAKTVAFKSEPISVGDLIQSVQESLHLSLQSNSLELRLFGDPALIVFCDPYWTQEALTNILKNSIEHSKPASQIDILYQDNPLYAEITIRDYGSGIPKDELPHIFQRFYRGKFASDDSVGIGLNLAHSIITAQNGTIDVRSSEGQGSSFIIKFYKQVV